MRRRYAAAAAGLCVLAVAGINVLLFADAADAYLLPINLGHTAGALLVFSLTAGAALAMLLTVAVIDDVSDELYFRVTAVVAVLSALGTALIPVLRTGRPAA